MTTPTTFRSDINDGIHAVLAAYAVAHPTQLVRAYKARPSNIAQDLPCAFVDSNNETITHDSGIRTRTMSPVVVVVHRYADNQEDADAFDLLVDGLVDAFTAHPQFAATTIWSSMRVDDAEEQVGDYLFPAVRFTFDNISISEGRV